MATPSLALIPSAYKANKVYSVIPVSGDGDFASARTSAATRVNSSGLIESVATGIPRIDYPIGGGCPSLLLEPARTNLCIRSEEFDNAAWNNIRSSETADQAVAPDGTTTADELIEDATASNTHYIRKTSNITGTVDTYTISVFAKANTRDYIFLTMLSTNSVEARFNVSTGVADLTNTTGLGANWTNRTYGIESYGNGWYRCYVTADHGNTSSIQPQIYVSDGNRTYNGDAASSVYIWGAQVEIGSYPTSYLKTEGSTVARIADTCNSSGTSAEFNDSEGVLYCEIAALSDDLTSRVISITDGTLNERINIAYSSTTNQITANLIDGGVTQVAFTHTVSDITDFTKVAFKYKLNDCALWVDGVEVATDVVATMPTGLDTLAFDQATNQDFYGRCKDLRVYATALSDADLTILTT